MSPVLDLARIAINHGRRHDGRRQRHIAEKLQPEYARSVIDENASSCRPVNSWSST